METTTRHREWHGLGQGWAHRAGSRSLLGAEEASGRRPHRAADI